MPSERVEDGLVVLYRFDEGDGATVHDTAPLQPPLDLSLTGTAFTWVADGLRFMGDDATIAESTSSTTKLDTACVASHELSLESWFTPMAVETAGPPRIVTYSQDAATRNFSLLAGSDQTGVEPPAFRARLRTDPLQPNGIPFVGVQVDTSANGALAHLVYTRHASGEEAIFIDAVAGAEDVRPGDFSSWDTTGAMRLALGNEFSSPRPFDGTLHLVAVYCRALEPDEVQQNFDAGL